MASKLKAKVEGPAHANVLELRATHVERERLHAGATRFDWDALFLDQPLLDGGKLVGRHPVLGDVLLPVVDLAGLERLERRRALAEIVDADHVRSSTGPFATGRSLAH